MRSCAPIHGLGGQDHQLPDRRVRLLCVASRPCLHRPGALSAEGMDGRSRTPESGACAGRGGFCHQAPDRAQNDRARHRRQGAVLPSLRRTACMARATSKPCCARRAKAMFWALPPITCSTPGARSCLLAVAAAKIAQSLPKSAWRRLSAGEGTKGPRLHDWAYLELADLDAGEYNNTLTGDVDARSVDPPQHCRRRSCLLLHLVSQGHAHEKAGGDRRPSLGHRRQLRNRQERTRSRSQRDADPGTAGTGMSRWSCSPSP